MSAFAALNAYDDGDDEPAVTTLPDVADVTRSSTSTSAWTTTAIVAVTPNVAIAKPQPLYHDSKAVAINVNLKADELFAPVSGPQHPLHRDALIPGQKNTLTGFVENHNMSVHQFSTQFESFRKTGVAEDPGSRGTVMSKAAAAGTLALANADRKTPRKRRERGDVAGEFWGSWAPPDDVAEGDDDVVVGATQAPLSDEQVAVIDEKVANAKRQRLAEAQAHAITTAKGMIEKERSVFHGKQLTDYQGRSYVHPPSDVKPRDHDCYIPKALLHTYAGHTKGVNCVRFFPTYGHLIFSASMDNTIKIWDYHNERRCLRTMYGHTKAVRDLCINADGKSYLSAGLDHMIRLWDTETGECVSRIDNEAIVYCVRSKPGAENELLAASHDKKIYGYDTRTGKRTQEYNEHQSAVNTITFIDNDRRFVSTSDDKRVFVWEYGIPVVIKHIADPTMHACVATAMRPQKDFVALQNLDNSVTIYQAGDKFRIQGKKVFRGHVTSGYAAQIVFSADGKYLASGDGNGRAVFWDFKSTRLYRTLKCHEGVCISVDWHPVDPSRFVTAGWDSAIKLWD